MKFKNAVIYGEDFRFRGGGFTVSDGVFGSLEEPPDGVDLRGDYVIPGLIDLHTHGNSGVDFSAADMEGLKRMAEYLAQNGVTSFAPASMTMPEETLTAAYTNAARFHELQLSDSQLRLEIQQNLATQQPAESRLLGIYMEGPFLSREKKGAQAEEYLMPPDVAMFERLYKASGGLLTISCIAPELPGSLDFIEKARYRCTVSIAHTGADYDTVKKAIEAGATQITHLYNGMPPLLHRAPGVIGAGAESEQVMAELICDGYHVHESAVRAAFSMFSAERIILVSDSLSCTGMPAGVYESGGRKVLLNDGAAVLEDGITLAGSATNLFQCMRNAISFGVEPEHAIRAATFNPAKALGAGDKVGSISPGKSADFVVCDRDFNIKQCYIEGKPVI